MSGVEYPKTTLETSLTLWGPSHSGKTCLLRALVRSLELLNLRRGDFRYELTHWNGAAIKVETDRPKPTEDLSSLPLRFRRRARASLASEAYQLSTSMKHLIHIVDARGDTLVNDQRPERFFELSNYYFFTIPIEPFSTMPSVSDELGKAVNNFTASLSAFSLNTQREPIIAVCLTKCDNYQTLLSRTTLETWRTGDGGSDFVQDFINWEQYPVEGAPAPTIKYFATSALGFIENPHTSSLAYLPANRNEDWLADPSAWKPRNVAAPFFWILEKREREHIKSISPATRPLWSQQRPIHLYIPYPPEDALN